MSESPPPSALPPSAPAPPPAPRAGRPAHLRPGLIALVVLGGCLGTSARYGLSLLVPTAAGGWPISTFVANLTGAFILGLLLETLSRAGEETPRRRAIRLTFGTGVLGGYTTYSAMALEITHLLPVNPLLACAYAFGSVILGFLAAGAGIALAARIHAARHRGEKGSAS